MAAHGRLKNEFREDEKCHNLISWLRYYDFVCMSDSGGGVWSENNWITKLNQGVRANTLISAPLNFHYLETKQHGRLFNYLIYGSTGIPEVYLCMPCRCILQSWIANVILSWCNMPRPTRPNVSCNTTTENTKPVHFYACCCCLFRLNITFNHFSVISWWCLAATGSSMLTFIVLPHWSIMLLTLDMIPHPVTISWHCDHQS